MKQTKHNYAVIALTAAAYFLAGRAGVILAMPPGFSSPLWPAAGVALAFTLLWGYRCIAGVWLGSFLVNILEAAVFTDASLLQGISLTAMLATGASLQAAAGAWLLRRSMRFPNALEQPRDILILILLGGLAACLISATIGNLSLLGAGVFYPDGFGFRWLTWWTGDVLGVCAVAPIMLIVFNDEALVSRGRKITVGVALVVIFLLAGSFYQSIRLYDERAYYDEFSRRAEKMALATEDTFTETVKVLTSIQSFVLAAGRPINREFEVFTRQYFMSDPVLTSVSWLQRVPHSERASFERSMRAQGVTDFAINERDRDEGQRVILSRAHEEYMPITCYSDGTNEKPPMGRDPYQRPDRREAMDRARDTGKPQAMAPVEVLRYPNIPAMLIFMPVYKEALLPGGKAPLQGYVAGMALVPQILKSLEQEVRAQGMHITLSIMNGVDNVGIYDSRTASRRPSSEPLFIHPQARQFSQNFFFAGKQFRVHLLEDNSFAAVEHHWSLSLLLLGQVLCVGLMTVFVLMLTGRADAVQRLVGEKTRELEYSQHRLQSVINNTADGLIAVDEQGIIQLFNRACERIFGFHSGEVLGCSAEVIFSLPGQPFRLSEERLNVQHEMQGRRRDGCTFPIEVVTGRVPLAGGEHVYIAAVRDITERKQAEMTRQKLIEKLTAVNEELEQFAYVASHDLREPVRMVMNFMTLLEQDYFQQLDAQGREYIDIAKQAARKMEYMISDLLEYARLSQEGQRFTGVDCNLVLQQVRENLAEAIESSHAVIQARLLPMVHANPVRFTRLLENLIGNAIKYSARGRPPFIRITAEDKNDHWLFKITDNGIGIRSEYLLSIFIPFKRLHTEQEYPGTGIGLAICKRIVESFGGTIWAQSEFDAGTTFYFTLPKREGL